MRLPIIDSDGHVMEPFDLWQERLPSEYRDMAWQRIRIDGLDRVQFCGRPTRFEWGAAFDLPHRILRGRHVC
jgi:hypothetical protein